MSDEQRPSDPASAPGRGYGFGTFKGVFTPSILTILGVIMYLRLGWVLGNVGLVGTLIIVTLASTITFLTGLSLSALATNRRIGGGGAYNIISRSLGLEAGAAIGLPLYFAQTLGIAFYVSGFSEAVVGALPGLDPRGVGLVTLGVLALLVYLSADLALKTQFLVLAVITASLVSFFAGGQLPASEAVTVAPAAREKFWVVFAIFFPAVTGIEAGIAMSGDLEDPARSLPRGTIAAVLLGYAVYLAIPVYLVWAVPDRQLLLTESLILRKVAAYGDLILIGVWAATLSSAMGSMLGAPRTLQALARDRVVPRLLGRGYGAGDDPRVATVVTFAVAAAGILAGDLNLIAPVLSMFFLTSYGTINVSAGLEEMVKPASWRPTFRIPFLLSLAGSAACFATMFMINAGATLTAMAIIAGVYSLMKRRSLRARWGDIRYGVLMVTAHRVVSRLAGRKPDERTWTPNILVFSGVPTRRLYLVELANAIAQGRNFLTVATCLPPESWTTRRLAETEELLRGVLARKGMDALVKVVAEDDPLAGALSLVNGYGFGPLVPNLVILGDTSRRENYLAYVKVARQVFDTRRNLVIVRDNAEEEEADAVLAAGSRIDLWWRGANPNVGLMLTLAYLMKRGEGWRDAELVVRQIVDADRDPADAERVLREFVDRQRIEARVEILVRSGSVYPQIREASRGASLVLMGMPPPAPDESLDSYSVRYQLLMKQTEDMPPTAFVLTAQEIDFLRIFSPGGP